MLIKRAFLPFFLSFFGVKSVTNLVTLCYTFFVLQVERLCSRTFSSSSDDL